MTGTTYNPPVAATIVANPPPSCALPTCIQVTAPAIVSGATYFVTVSTPGGTSQTTSSDSNSFVPTFTYTPVVPTVKAIVGTAAGSTIGNTTITVQGTGFWNASNNPQYPAQVSFCPTTGVGSCVAGSVVSISPPSSGSTLDTMTALTPAVTCSAEPLTYYVQVEVYNQYSSLANAPSSPTRCKSRSSSASVLAAPRARLRAASAAWGQARHSPSTAPISLGTGTCPATTQTCVALYLYNTTTGSQSGNAINVPTSVTSSTSITITVPNTGLTANSVYVPVISLPSSYGVPSSQPYNENDDLFTYT